MIEGIEPFYQKIAEGIQAAILEPWQSATVEVIFFSQSSNYEGEFINGSEPHPKGFEIGFAIIRPFLELRELFKKAGKPLWCRARFELSPDGKFKMNWGYDDCDENGFAPFDEKKESERQRQRRLRLGSSS